MDPSGGANNSAGGPAQQPPRPDHNAVGQQFGAEYTNPVRVMPFQVQLIDKHDDRGRRYLALENLPLDKNYVANWINSGGEFAIGGSPRFICQALANELESRATEDAENQLAQPWHVVVLPESNMSNPPRYHFYRESPVTQQYRPAITLRPTQQNPLNNQPAMFSQQDAQHDQQAFFSQQNPHNNNPDLMPRKRFRVNQQPILIQNNPMGGYEQGGSSVAPSHQLQFNMPIPGIFSSGGGSTMPFPQEQFQSQTPQQSSFQGFQPSNGPAQSSYQGQGSNWMLNQSIGYPIGVLPQVHRPIFDRYGYIIGDGGNMNASNTYEGNMYDGNMYDGNMYRSNMYGNNMTGPGQPMPFQVPQQQFNPPQLLQNVETSNQQLEAAAQAFFSFVRDKMDKDEDNQDDGAQDESEQDEDDQYESEQDEGDEDERDQDEGIALGNNTGSDSFNAQSEAAPLQPAPALTPPSSSREEALWASDREPHRFADNTGTNLCDYCGRDGHEADACIKWDPVHFDKPVCTACNNDQHALDECPKFRAMATPERVALLFGKGGRRPGVRSEDHAWTSYFRRGDFGNEGGGGGGGGGDGGGGSLPLTRRFLRDLSLDKASGAMVRNIWKVWDYRRGVPDQFRGPTAESLAANPTAPLDERFMGGKYKLGWGARTSQFVLGHTHAQIGAGLMPFPRSVTAVAQNQLQPPQSAGAQAGNGDEEEGDDTEL